LARAAGFDWRGVGKKAGRCTYLAEVTFEARIGAGIETGQYLCTA
jgi:hypothetical protein